MKTYILSTIIILASVAGNSQSLQGNPPTLSTERNDLSLLIDSLQKTMKTQKMVGSMIGIIRNDSTIFSGGFGYADIENKIQGTETTLFRLGSITKMFVALGILKLVEDGKLRLDDKISDIAPEIPFQNPYEETDPLKVIHLLEHTSGFDDIKLNRMYSYEETNEDGLSMMMVHAPSMACRWKPGERTSYSNPNYAALGFIIEKISKKRYDQFLRDQILTPLQMNLSNFNLGSSLKENTKEYMVSGSDIEKVPSVYLKSGPQGALWSNSNEMLSFIHFLIQGGKPFVSENTFALFEMPQSSLAARCGLSTGYAKGNSSSFLFAKSNNWRGHDGITGTCFSGCYYNRELKSGFIISINSNQSIDPLAQLIVSFLEKDYSPSTLATVPLDKKIISPYLGYYEFQSPRNEISAFLDEFTNTQHVFVSNDALHFKTISGTSSLVSVSPLSFTWEGMNRPLVIFNSHSGLTTMCIGGTYYRKVSEASVIGKRILLGSVGFLLLNGFALAIFSLIQFLRRRIGFIPMAINSLPALALIFLIIVFQQLFYIKEFSYLLADLSFPGIRSISIFGCTLVFALLSIVAGYYSFKRLKTERSYANWYYCLIVVASIFTTVYLSLHGIIALRPWAM